MLHGRAGFGAHNLEHPFDAFLAERYAGWGDAKAQAMLAPDATLEGVAARVAAEGIDPKPRSGRQEWVENLVNRYL